MKNSVVIFILIFASNLVFAQTTPTTDKAKDTIKTEVVNVVTSYTPKVTDAFKIKKKPTIKLSEKTARKKLQYNIFSVPVASTFIPKSGTLKGVDLGQKERLYNNYLAVGFGNNITPFIETYLGYSTRFENNFGIYAKYISSQDPIKNTQLNSSFGKFLANVFYTQEDRYFNWKVGLDTELSKYNWYGIPAIAFNQSTINSIEEGQSYNFVNAFGEIMFDESYIDSGKLSVSYFLDDFKSNEIQVKLQPKFKFPLDVFGQNFNALFVDFSLEYLQGEFARSYENNTAIQHRFFVAGLTPTYNFEVQNFDIKLGGKIYFSSDIENNSSQFFAYPDVQISYPILKDIANIYVGATGDLHNNTYKNFSDLNPYVSPTLHITQTNEMYNFFAGLKGKLSSNISYNAKVSYINEEDKAMFAINNTKSNGSTTASNGIDFLGYEYGNSFNVYYDDVKTLAFFGEIEYDFSKKLTIGANAQVNSYTPTRQLYTWNLPNLKSEMFAKYNAKKWYAGTNIFFVSSRKDVAYTGTFPSTSNAIDLPSYFDVNVHGGYLFNDKFSAFLKVNNIFNNEYNRYINYQVQGFQILGGFTWKFDF